MADRTSLEKVNDGDLLSEGYFNGVVNKTLTNKIIHDLNNEQNEKTWFCCDCTCVCGIADFV